MYVRKFEADSLEEALKEIKRELGPDAIILKTVSNKGLKGALKKKKIEITAAISEKTYVKKAKVDNVLNSEQKEKFYNNQSAIISNMIDNYDSNKPGKQKSQGGYGNLGLNRSVQVSKDENDSSRHSETGTHDFDRFLSHGTGQTETLNSRQENDYETLKRETPKTQSISEQTTTSRPVHVDDSDSQKRLYQIERKIAELTRELERIRPNAPLAVINFRQTLLALNINPSYVTTLLRKIQFNLNDQDINNEDMVYEFGMKEMLEAVKTRMPLFAKSDIGPTVIVLISDNPCGQSSFLRKMVSMRENAKILSLRENHNHASFTEKILNIQNEHVDSYPKMLTAIKTAQEEGKDVFIDLRTSGKHENDIKKYLEGVRRSFKNVEVLICLSAIHSETYNSCAIKRYQPLSDGLVVNYLDQCLEYGTLFNLATQYANLPFVFFGTGCVIPDDVESATAERILSGIFKFS